MISYDYNNPKIIPNPGDEDTRMRVTIERIIARLPSLEGQAGKVLKVAANEEACVWSTGGGGGSVSFADILGSPSDNTALLNALNGKVNKATGSAEFSVGIDAGGLYYEV